jgi:hypothetical protein
MIVDRGGRPPSLRFGHSFHPCKCSSDVLIVACSYPLTR